MITYHRSFSKSPKPSIIIDFIINNLIESCTILHINETIDLDPKNLLACRWSYQLARIERNNSLQFIVRTIFLKNTSKIV